MGRWSSDVYEIYCRMSAQAAVRVGLALSSQTVTPYEGGFRDEVLELQAEEVDLVGHIHAIKYQQCPTPHHRVRYMSVTHVRYTQTQPTDPSHTYHSKRRQHCGSLAVGSGGTRLHGISRLHRGGCHERQRPGKQ